MPKEIIRQVSWTGGELDPLVQGRRDLKAYFQGAAKLENHMVRPQGPATRRFGTAFIDTVRRPLVTVDISGATRTAPSGGNANKVVSDTDGVLLTTAPMGTDNPYVLVQIDFGGDVEIGAVDLVNFASQTGVAVPGEPPHNYPWGALIP